VFARDGVSAGRRLFEWWLSVLGGSWLTIAFFLVLPLIQTIAEPPEAGLLVTQVDTASLPPPPPPPEPEPEQEEEPEEPPPELIEDVQPLDLSQLELALEPGFGEGWMSADFAVKLETVATSASDVDALFSIADLDQKPRAVYQPSPTLMPAMRKKTPGTVYVLFVVDQKGRVQDPVVQKSTDPVFDKATLDAIKQWRFEPGKRKGQEVRFRMRVPITFPKE